ncbi:MAG: hypothetical protein OIF57_08700 [Marinobacterium sp.]|nr:hypothetical protein [Marinobacterium sp.]
MAIATRLLRVRIDSPDGTHRAPLSSFGVHDANSAVYGHTNWSDVSVHTQVEDGDLCIALKSNGVHFRPQPWNASLVPIDVQIRIDTQQPDTSGPARCFNSPSGLVHTIKHNMGTRHFIERIFNATSGEPEFAEVEVIDDNAFEVRLAVPAAVTVAVVFVTDTQEG